MTRVKIDSEYYNHIILIPVIFVFVGVYVVITTSTEDWQRIEVTNNSQSTITKIDRYGNRGLALTENGQVWLLNRDYVCQLNLPESIDIYLDGFLNYFILTKDMSILGIDMKVHQFNKAISVFSTGCDSTIQSLQPVRLVSKCELVKVETPIIMNEFNQSFTKNVIVK